METSWKPLVQAEEKHNRLRPKDPIEPAERLREGHSTKNDLPSRWEAQQGLLQVYREYEPGRENPTERPYTAKKNQALDNAQRNDRSEGLTYSTRPGK